MGWPLWVQILIDVLHHYRILTTDTPWLACKGDTWGDLCEFKFWLMYYITTGSSQQTSHGSPVRVIHGVTSVSSNSDWCITSLQGPHNRHPMARPQGASPASSNSDRCILSLQDPHSRHPMNGPWGQHMGCPLWVQILINISDHYRTFTTDTPWPTCKSNIVLALVQILVNSLWPSDAIWRQGSRSTLVQVMACCLMTPSHYLNQCWLIIS